MLPTSQQTPANSASTLLLTSISTLPSSPLSSQAAVKLQFTSLLFASLFHGPPNHSSTSPKAIARGLGSTPTSSGVDGGNFFVPADGVPPAPGTEKVPDEDEDEPPSSLLQLLTEHLSLSMLARSKVEDNVIEARLWDRVIVGYLTLLCTWLWEDPKGVRIFLEGGGVGVVSPSFSQSQKINDTLSAGGTNLSNQWHRCLGTRVMCLALWYLLSLQQRARRRNY
jgi:intracellular protein transport protein USO1